MLGWLRERNAGGGQVHFAGLDLPGSGGSALPALLKVRDYLARRASTELADAAIEATALYRSANNSVAFARYSELDEASRDAATAALARLLLQLDAMPVKDSAHLIARHHALGALRLDEHLREFTVLGVAQAPAKVVSSRDVYHAETVRLLRELHGPEARIVLMMHNAHIQRVPMELLPGIRAESAGTHLAGPAYVAIAVTATGGTTTDTELDEEAPQGFTVVGHPAGPPAEDSVEAAVTGQEPVLLDLRAARLTEAGEAPVLADVQAARAAEAGPAAADRRVPRAAEAGQDRAAADRRTVLAAEAAQDPVLADVRAARPGGAGQDSAAADRRAALATDAGQEPAPADVRATRVTEGGQEPGSPDLRATRVTEGGQEPGSPDLRAARATEDGQEPGPSDLQALQATEAAIPRRIRHVTTHLAVDLPAAFDGVVCLPAMTPDDLTTPR
ncbi:erythromycin esterase family protein [Amycolatopsis sp. 195334CR]|uniref:erythromycin esterase family protein n=1 Tax=Amycolatopsis sp. 195334CR TaxID=2814588 RepID=UPI001A90B147|nr:erythromycin esterase family protein [Amycolatopsis sp. 195334CR]MBN6042066.1 erythromycin esterase family protein [Amycolatopsis sp. 195334CR]